MDASLKRGHWKRRDWHFRSVSGAKDRGNMSRKHGFVTVMARAGHIFFKVQGDLFIHLAIFILFRREDGRSKVEASRSRGIPK